jgi:hypothetical protein
MSHPRRYPSVSAVAHSSFLAVVARLRRWWFPGRACTARVERDPRWRDAFRPGVDALEDRHAPNVLLGLLFPPLFGDGVLNLGNPGGGGRSGAARGSGRAAQR